jgi:hypothetical protein
LVGGSLAVVGFVGRLLIVDGSLLGFFSRFETVDAVQLLFG